MHCEIQKSHTAWMNHLTGLALRLQGPQHQAVGEEGVLFPRALQRGARLLRGVLCCQLPDFTRGALISSLLQGRRAGLFYASIRRLLPEPT